MNTQMANRTLEEWHTLRDQLKSEAAALRAYLVTDISAWVLGTPVSAELHDAFRRLVRVSAHLQDVENSIAAESTIH